MPCPSCGARVDPDAWICGACDHILDPSVLEPKEDKELPIQAERTRLVAWAPPEENDEYPDAVILGDVGVAEEEFSVVAGAQAGGNGRTSTFLFYAGGSSTRVVHPHAIPHLTNLNDTLPRTPYEDFILSCIDGEKSVRQIQKESGLAPQEIVVTLLTLMDKGAVDIRTADGRPGASPRPENEEQLTESEGAGAGDVNSDYEDIPEVASSEIDELQPAMLMQESAVFERPSTQDLLDPSENDHTENFYPDEVESDVLSADSLVEKESTVHESSGGFNNEYESLTPEEEAELPPVMPSPLEDDDGTEPTRELEIPAAATKHLKSKAPRPQTPGPRRAIRESSAAVRRQSSAMVRPVSEADPRGPSVRRSKAPSVSGMPAPSVSGMTAPARAEMPPPSVSGMPAPSASGAATSSSHDIPPPSVSGMPAPSVSRSQPGLSRPASKPVLDASFLSEVEKSSPAVPPRPSPTPEVEKSPTGDLSADLLAPPLTPKPAGKLSSVPGPAVVEAAKAEPLVDAEKLQAERKRSFDAAASAEPVDSVRMLKAQRLFEQALKDKAEGNLVSARMNVKLALTFDPSNDLFAKTFDEMSKNSTSTTSGAGQGRSIARDLYDQATSAENRGDVDAAVELLEKAIRESKNPAFYNRLGVILAMKKQEFSRAQEMIEKAIELAPNNGTYEKNLHKVLSRAALHARKGGGGKRKGIRGLFGRRK